MNTLEDYIKENVKNQVIDFSIRATVNDSGVTFYIHPTHVSGETKDFKVAGNIVIPINNKAE